MANAVSTVASNVTPLTNGIHRRLNCVHFVLDTTATTPLELVALTSGQLVRVWGFYFTVQANAGAIQLTSNGVVKFTAEGVNSNNYMFHFYPLLLLGELSQNMAVVSSNGSQDIAGNLWYTKGSE